MFGVYIAALVLALLAILIAGRELRRWRLWSMFGEGLEAEYPLRVFCPDLEALGVVRTLGGPKIGPAACYATDKGYWLRRIGPFYFGRKSIRIPWQAIDAIEFKDMVWPSQQGDDYSGFATITLTSNDEIRLCAPWRGDFDKNVPDTVSLESTQVVSNKT